MKTRICLVFLSSLLSLTVSAAVQDQSQSQFGAWADMRSGGAFDLTQTFTVGIAGSLAYIQHSGESPYYSEYPTTFSIVDTVNGRPGTNVLGKSVVTNLSAQQTVYFDNVYLDLGVMYGILITTEAPAPANSFVSYSFRTSCGDSYLQGSLWSRPVRGDWSLAHVSYDNSVFQDLIFATFMEPGVPPVRLTTPTGPVTVNVGQTVNVAAALSSSYTNGALVNFYANDQLIGAAAQAPYSTAWIPNAPGSFNLTGVLVNGGSAIATSSVVQITVVQFRPANDDFANRIILTGEVASSTIVQTNATLEQGEPRLGANAAGKSLWWQWTAPRSAWATFTLAPTPQPNALLGLFTGSQVQGLFTVASSNAVLTSPVTGGTIYQIEVDATGTNDLTGSSLQIALNDIEISSPGSGSVYHAPVNLILAASRTANVRNLQRIDVLSSAVVIGQLPLDTRQFPCAFPQPGYYTLRVDATDDQGITTRSKDVQITVRPGNDDFSAAQPIAGRAVAIQASTIGATLQVTQRYPWSPRVGEPTWGDNQGGHSIWYSWTAPADGMCTVSGQGDSFAPLFNVCLGSSVWSLSVVAANALAGENSPVAFDAVKNTTYFISVDGMFGEEGLVDWNLSLNPYNDNFSGRRVLAGVDVDLQSSNDGATVESGEAAILPAGAGSTLWFTWQAPISGEIAVQVNGTTPLAVEVFQGQSLNSLSMIAQSSNGWSNVPTLNFTAQASNNYQIAVIGQGGATGPLEFRLALQGLRLTSPKPNTIVPVGARLPLTAALSIPSKSLQTVTFSTNGTVLAVATNAPFTVAWSPPGIGTYSISATAIASDNSLYESVPVTCLVYAGKDLPRPRVYAGVGADCSYVINGVGALYLFGGGDSQFGRPSTVTPSTPFLGSWPAGVTGWKEISGTCGISDDGKLYQDGQTLTPFPPNVSAWLHVSLGFGGVVTVANNGDLYINGTTRIPVPTPPGGWLEARATLTGVNNGLIALGADHEAYLMGPDYWGVTWSASLLTRPAGVNGWKAIAQAALFSVLLTDTDELYIYGEYGGVMGTSSPGGFEHVPRPAGVNRWVDFAAGGFHVLAIGDDSQLYAWGRNWELQLGIAQDQNSRPTPVQVVLPPGVTGWSSVAGGQFHSIAIANDCSVYAWGANDNGQLGQPNSAPLARPIRVGLLDALCGTPILFTDGIASRKANGSFTFQFNTDLNRRYLIQYSDDMIHWNTANDVVVGTGSLVTWVDDGPPKTATHPRAVVGRSYRCVYAP